MDHAETNRATARDDATVAWFCTEIQFGPVQQSCASRPTSVVDETRRKYEEIGVDHIDRAARDS
jgi:hypothetical protein